MGIIAMVTRVQTVAFQGIDAVAVDVQVMVAPGRVGMSIVGLADKAVAESRERVQAALHASGLSMPPKRVTVNLAPADLPKEGSHYDLPIALCLMAALGALPSDALQDYVILGELSLDGGITPIAGTLPAAIAANGWSKGLICPEACGPEAAWASPDMDIIAPASLIALANHFKGTQILSAPVARIAKPQESGIDLSDIKGQITAKRALEVAAAGGHNMLMVGPPGSGKSMLAARMATILPPLDPAELLEVSMIASIAGQLPEGKLSDQRPFRAPHHSASMAAMVGGGIGAQPGEVSLAHHGVLFLDELPEFSPRVLDSLRQPLEAGECIIARANHRVCYPSRVQLIAAMNPCKCGMAGEPGHRCRRGDRCVTDYQQRLSGPFLDRIDIRIDVPAVTASEIMAPISNSETSAVVLQRVNTARKLQYERLKDRSMTQKTNAAIGASDLETVVNLHQTALSLLHDSASALKFSARAYHRILKVSRTIADLDQSIMVHRHHLAEAISYRANFQALPAAA